MTWEEFEEKKYFVFSDRRGLGERPARPAGLLRRPQGQPAARPRRACWSSTPSASRQHFPDDKERPPYPEVDREGRDPRRAALQRAGRHVPAAPHVEPPALAHARPGRRHHWARETPTGKVLGSDGYNYEPVWLNPVDAAARGIKHGDDRQDLQRARHRARRRAASGSASCRAWSTSTTAPATTPSSPARSTAAAPSTPSPRNGLTSKNACGQATSGYLVGRAEESRPRSGSTGAADYPEAFAREYDHGAGLRFNAWIEGGNGVDEGIRHRRRRSATAATAASSSARTSTSATTGRPSPSPSPIPASSGCGSTSTSAAPCRKVAHALRPEPLHALRRSAVHARLPGRRRHLQARRRPGHHRHRSSAPAARPASTPARTTPSTSTTTSTWRRSAPAAPTCSTAASGRRPRCVDACPTEAIKFGEESEFADLIAQAEVLEARSWAPSRASTT